MVIRMMSALLLVTSLSACGADPDGAGAGGASNAADAGDASAARAQSAAARDLTTFNVCALVPAADVARILGASPDQVLGEPTMGTMASDCTYTVERGDQVRDYAMIWIYSPQMWDPSMIEPGTTIEGLGDSAYRTKTAGGAMDQVMVRREGDFVLDARAASPQQAQQLAELAVGRLTGSGG
jgi:hypothetical protein